VKSIFSTIKTTLLLIIVLATSGCSIMGGTEPETINVMLIASETLNQNIEKRSSPVVLRIYQLSQIDKFNNSDFFALYENDKSILAEDITYREEFEVKPGQSTTIPLEINLDTKFIAVLAAFRDLDKAQWKSILEIDPLEPQAIKINLDEFNVLINIIPE